MNSDLLHKLRNWRRDAAQKEGVDLFRILSNSTIEAIASFKPKTKEELMSVKGIKERKFEKYGASILALVNGSENESEIQGKEGEDKKPYTISGYLNFLNTEFKKYKARIQGEISSLDIRDGYLFFSLKDKD
ncbi:MAG: HRDC domain-containing protein, partial [Candidatus Taylorbacteria bacterium]|nr:HRDC domain-containing protein [Candidatus Taylorbacteria bacterium]